MRELGDEEAKLIALLESCDRTRSHEARESLSRILWRPLLRYNLMVSPSCRLSAEVDILAAQESSKHLLSSKSVSQSMFVPRRSAGAPITPTDTSHWRCALCGKKFRSEHFIDKHLARRHARVVPSRQDITLTCFADLCGIAVPCLPLSATQQQAVPSVSTRLLVEEVARRRSAREMSLARDVAMSAEIAGNASDHEHQDNPAKPLLVSPPSTSAEVANEADIAEVGADHEADSVPSFCTDDAELNARRHTCVHIVDTCLSAAHSARPSSTFRPSWLQRSTQGVSSRAVAWERRRLHVELCEDALRAACMSFDEQREWRAEISTQQLPATKIRHACGWALLFALLVALGVGRWLRRARAGHDELALRAARVLHARRCTTSRKLRARPSNAGGIKAE